MRRFFQRGLQDPVDEEPCGYGVLGFDPDWIPLHQVCVARDARRLEHGRALIAAAGRLARRRGALGLRLRCAADLPANEFWRALGFEPVRIERPKNRRRRAIITYVLPTADPATLLPFARAA
jgi:GNAT superfamily N-acetyltransferase